MIPKNKLVNFINGDYPIGVPSLSPRNINYFMMFNWNFGCIYFDENQLEEYMNGISYDEHYNIFVYNQERRLQFLKSIDLEYHFVKTTDDVRNLVEKWIDAGVLKEYMVTYTNYDDYINLIDRFLKSIIYDNTKREKCIEELKNFRKK